MVSGHTRHHARISQKDTIMIFDSPPCDAMFIFSGAIPIKFLSAQRFCYRPTKIGHDFRIGVHIRKDFKMIVPPMTEVEALGFDHV